MYSSVACKIRGLYCERWERRGWSRTPLRSPFDTSFLERSPFSEYLSRSRYLHLGFHASTSQELGSEEKEREREIEWEREGRFAGSSLTLYVAFCPPLIILSLPFYSYLSVYIRSNGTNLSGAKLSLCVSNPLCARERHEGLFGRVRDHVFPYRGSYSGVCRYV